MITVTNNRCSLSFREEGLTVLTQQSSICEKYPCCKVGALEMRSSQQDQIHCFNGEKNLLTKLRTNIKTSRVYA